MIYWYLINAVRMKSKLQYRSIVKKIVFDKENKTLDFHYYIKED